ncbi:hypothetical protein DCC81_00595 [Chitinophaga parva]|uniref:DUF1003 domain-containing protein n=1 Tax=Chitinophaga parva TaxID=2169414 RepID=A0A2T7BK23_9BACT|nr:DUF1003 domain-containing protein [Chitinophaga parva]PUZ28018.1 hypothetical protein DCC81_00595 [Chitinophaga parva]
MQTFTSDLSGKTYPLDERVPAKALRASIMSLIQAEHPAFSDQHCLAMPELQRYRQKYYEKLIRREVQTLTDLERQVLEKLRLHENVAQQDPTDTMPLTPGQRLADKIADFGGSWTFIGWFGGIIVVWMAINVFLLSSKAFDPYPFILLNLVLSCLAALQAPVIMMSQNRQEEKDRVRARNDYMVNLKSEMEIRIIHEKLDHLLINQQQDMMELQQIQISMMNDILEAVKK